MTVLGIRATDQGSVMTGSGRDSGLVMTGTAARASQLSASGHSRVEDVVGDEHDRVEPLMITTARSKLCRGRTPSAAPGPRWASV